MSFILKIFVYLAAFNIFYENNDETFVKLEAVNLRCLKFESSVTSDNWSILLVKFLHSIALGKRRCREDDSFLETRAFDFKILRLHLLYHSQVLCTSVKFW